MVRRQINEHQLAAFVVIVFTWSWSWDAIYYLLGWWDAFVVFPRQWGLPIAAIVVWWADTESLRTKLGSVLAWRLRPAFYLVAVLVPVSISNAQPVVRALGGGTLAYAPPASLPLLVAFVLANMFLFGGVEELGWRGFLQPRLQHRTSVLTAGLGIGLLWLLWHLPLFFSGKAAYSLQPLSFLTYTTFILGAAVVLGAFVNVTDGTVLPVMLMHASINLGPVLEGSSGALAGSKLLPLVFGSGLWWLIVLVLVLRYGKRMVPEPTATSEA